MSTTSFETFFGSFDPDPRIRGKQWEHACKWLLENDPVYRSTIKTVWLWDEWPDKDGPDAGIDLVAKTKKDELWAIQAKAWDKETNVTKHDMGSFIAESEGSRFGLRLLITTSKGVARAVQTLENRGELHPPLRRMCRHDLEDREWPASFSDLKQGWKVPRAPATPRPHQQEALNAALGGLRGTNRGQLIMACGTGNPSVVLVDAAVAPAPGIELAGRDAEPGDETPGGDLCLLGPAPHEIDDLVAHVGRRPAFG